MRGGSRWGGWLGGLLVLGLASAAPVWAADPVVVAAGDVACAPTDTDYHAGVGTVPPAATPGRCHQNYVADLITSLGPTNLLALGDLQYEDGALARFNVSYEASWGRAPLKAVTRPVPGNHEYGAGNTNNGNIHHDANATGYFAYFDGQLADGTAASDPQRGWYSFDIPVGNSHWHIVALNSECAAGLRVTVGWDGDCAVGSEQERWLRADLAADTSNCTIAYWHHPRFSSGDLGDNIIMAPIWNALHDDYADIVLSGHDHNYERAAPRGTTGLPEPGRGIREFVVGTGGKGQLPLGAPEPGTEVLRNDAHGVLKLTLHGANAAHPIGSFDWRFLNDGNSGSSLTDAGSGDCVGPPRPAAAGSLAKPAPKAVADRIAPKLSLARLSRRRFRVGSGPTARTAKVRRGTVIGYTLSEAARSSLKFERRKKGRYRRAGVLKRKKAVGRRRVRFSGRIGRRALKAGRYRLTITARDTAGNLGKGKRLYFTAVR